ncbi:hypothetical protein R3P38DRAFT_3320534 [Favolaschia claudopus]|uniref:Uncharacterized protein n=1 Tax=Favolaschia claudopus TaxID=2862362 RepID=A0AAW0AYK7_9AGAR
MEAFFDNKTNILNARICAKLDASEMYTVETKFDFHGRIQTILRDRNPVLSGSSSVGVGAINWKEKTFEVKGQKSKYHQLRRTKGNLFNKTRGWRWSATRKEYDLSYSFEEWKAVLDDGVTVAGTFSAPFHEVFLLLVFIYEEVKRQDKTNTSTPGGTGGW